MQDSSGSKKIKWNILGNWAMADSRQVFPHTGIWASLSSGFSQGSDPVFSPQDLGKSLLPNLHIQPADPQRRPWLFSAAIPVICKICRLNWGWAPSNFLVMMGSRFLTSNVIFTRNSELLWGV